METRMQKVDRIVNELRGKIVSTPWVAPHWLQPEDKSFYNLPNNMNLLPDNYEQPKTKGGYYKFEKGDNRFRMISPAITGWIDWDKSWDKPKPIRTKEQRPALGENAPKHFWTMRVFDYESNSVKILEITQVSVQDAIYTLTKDSDWWPVDWYDIVVTRTGDGMETKYSVVPKPQKALTKEQLQIIKDTYVNLDALYRNEDPFLEPQGNKREADPSEMKEWLRDDGDSWDLPF